MKDFKNNPEIVKNIEHFIDGGSNIRLSLVICVWNTSHLLRRAVECYAKQYLPTDLWELIVIDDNSEDNVQKALEFGIGKYNIRYIRLEHNYGMRGNTVAFNTGFAWARGYILAESTPETLLTEDLLKKMYEPHLKYDNIFVSVKTWNLTREVQVQIDTVNWREDLGNIMQIDGFFNDWTLNNLKTVHFGTHQTCSIRKDVFYRLFPNGFPLYCDYGSEDPRYSWVRERNGVRDITIMQPMAFHTWHGPWSWWTAIGKSPNTNRHGHTTSNVMNDDSGQIPPNGTCGIWDGGSTEGLTEEEKAGYKKELNEWFIKTGGDPVCLIEK